MGRVASGTVLCLVGMGVAHGKPLIVVVESECDDPPVFSLFRTQRLSSDLISQKKYEARTTGICFLLALAWSDSGKKGYFFLSFFPEWVGPVGPWSPVLFSLPAGEAGVCVSNHDDAHRSSWLLALAPI